MKKRYKKFVLAIESKTGWVVCFILGKKKPPENEVKQYLKNYDVKSWEFFTISCT